MQHGLNYRISSNNFIADWTIIMGKISIAGLALATSELATTDFPECSHQLGPDFIFPKRLFGKKSVILGSYQHSWFSKWPFFYYNEAEDTVICHSCMKKNKTSTKADPAFVSSASSSSSLPNQSYSKIIVISKYCATIPIIAF